MAIEQVAAARVKRHEAELEQALAAAIKHRSRVRRVFKQLPAVAGAGFDLHSGMQNGSAAFAVQPRYLRATSAVTARTEKPIALDRLLQDGKEFILATLANEDRYLLRKLIWAATPTRSKGGRSWDDVLTGLDPAPTKVGEEWRFAEPQTLLSLVPGDPDDAATDELKKRNVAVVMASAAAWSTCAGLLVPTNSDGVTLRVEKDWHMMWDARGDNKIDFLMEASWSESVRRGGPLRIEG